MPEPDIQLHFAENFYQRYIEHTREADTYAKAYQLTEQEYHAVFGRNRYASYGSFRSTISQKLNRERGRKADQQN